MLKYAWETSARWVFKTNAFRLSVPMNRPITKITKVYIHPLTMEIVITGEYPEPNNKIPIEYIHNGTICTKSPSRFTSN